MTRCRNAPFLAGALLLSACLSAPKSGDGDGGSPGIDAPLIDAPLVEYDAGYDADLGPDARIVPSCDGTGPTEIRQISAGDDHTCAVISDGRLFCWGVGGSGRLGYGHEVSVGDVKTPAVNGAVDLADECAVQVATGLAHTCVLLESGGVRCWGSRSHGAIGLSPAEDSAVLSPPAQNVALTALGSAKVVEIKAGARHTCARLDDGNVRCWGSNVSGQLGHSSGGITLALSTNVTIGGVAVELALGEEHTCARLQSGGVTCWGEGGYGRLGYNGVLNVSPSAAGTTVSAGDSVLDISAGGDHSCAVVIEAGSYGLIRCWGRGLDGRLGNGDVLDVGDDEVPSDIVAIDRGAHATHISAGEYHTCAVVAGRVDCWGGAGNGQLGYNTNVGSVGDSVDNPLRGDLVTGIEPIKHVALGRNHTCALSESGRVRCWGSGAGGRLGHGDTNQIGGSARAIGDVVDVPVWCDDDTIPCE